MFSFIGFMILSVLLSDIGDSLRRLANHAELNECDCIEELTDDN